MAFVAKKWKKCQCGISREVWEVLRALWGLSCREMRFYGVGAGKGSAGAGNGVGKDPLARLGGMRGEENWENREWSRGKVWAVPEALFEALGLCSSGKRSFP